VLIVALVSVALLGFFPSMATDAQITQSQTYWQSAQPIAITEWGARAAQDSGHLYNFTAFYFRLKNTGGYPITLTKIYAGNQSSIYMCTGWWGPCPAMSIALAPGEEYNYGCPVYFPGMADPGSGSRKFLMLGTQYTAPSNPPILPYGAAKSYCSGEQPYGYLMIENLGFDYTQMVNGQAITKKQIGAKPIAIKCMNNYN